MFVKFAIIASFGAFPAFQGCPVKALYREGVWHLKSLPEQGVTNSSLLGTDEGEAETFQSD
jgi:hypothetical protein